MSARLHRMSVEYLCSESHDFEIAGQVLLTDGACRSHVEHALAAVGVYAPRGADKLQWHDVTSYACAWILDSAGNVIVRLRAES